MTMDNAISLYLILASQSFLLGAACIALHRFQRRCEAIEAFWKSPTGAMLADEADEELHKPESTRIVTVASEEALLEKLKLDQRISDLQRRLREIAERAPAENLPRPVEIERSLPIEHALRMAKNGASAEELTRACGLNVGEARLLCKLHGRKQRPEYEERQVNEC